MALDVKKINPLDLQPRKAVGVDLPFGGSAVFNSTYQTKDAIKANLINYFLTNKQERYLNPGFGAGLRDLLFENIDPDTIEELSDKIKVDLKAFFPRVIVTSLELTPEYDRNAILFSMRYAIRDTNIQDEVSINFEQ